MVVAKKNSLKNCKPLVDLIDTATPAALALLSPVECFGFLSAVDRTRPDHEIRSDIKTTIASLRRDVVAVASQEAVRLLQLMSFRTEMLLQHAFDGLTARGGADLSSFDQGADAMTRLIWLRSLAPRMFDEIETIYLTHHFHGHKKFHAFAIPDGDGCEFTWSDDVGDRLHEAVTEILELDVQAKEACEIIHFEMDEQTDDQHRTLHYVVVYHPGKMKLLRAMNEQGRDLLPFTPALEATLVYDPQQRRIHVLSPRANVAKRLADRFSQVGFERPLSREPVNAVRYNLSIFRSRVDWQQARAPGARVVDAWMGSIKVTLGHTRHTVTLALDHRDDAWQVAGQSFGPHDPLSRCRRVLEVVLRFVVRFDGEETDRALDITIDDRGACNLFNLADHRLRQCGEALLTSLGVMHRVMAPKSGVNVDLFRAEMSLLDLGSPDIDGLCVRELGLDAMQLSNVGLLMPLDFANEVTMRVDDDDGHHQILRRLKVRSSSTQTWAEDELTGARFDLQDVDQRRFRIDRQYLRERLIPLLNTQLMDGPVTPDDTEPYFLGDLTLGTQRVPVYLASRLWDARHADRLDTDLRHSSGGLSAVLTTTEEPVRRFLGPAIVVPLHRLIVDDAPELQLDLSRITGELRRWHGPAQSVQSPTLLKEGPYSAMLVGPWPSPWTLTKPDWIAVVEVLVHVWNSNARKISKTDLERRCGVTIRSMRELFKDAPEWVNYVRGADGNAKPRVWELNIGQADHQARSSTVEAAVTEPAEA